MNEHYERYSIRKKTNSHWFLGSLGCTAGILIVITSIATGGLGFIPMLPIAIISVLLTLSLGKSTFSIAIKELIHTKSINEDTFLALGTFSVLVESIVALFVPWLPMMFEAGLLIYGFKHISLAIQEAMEQKKSSNPMFFQESTTLENNGSHLLTDFTPLVFTLIFCLSLATGILFSPLLGLQYCIILLLSAYPYTFNLIEPFAIGTGLYKASTHVHYIDTKILQEAEQIDVLVFNVHEPSTNFPFLISELKAMGKEVYLYRDEPNKDISSSINQLRFSGKKIAWVGSEAQIRPAEDYAFIVRSEKPNNESTKKKINAIIPNVFSLLTIFTLSSQTVSNSKQNARINISLSLSLIAVSGISLFAFGFVLTPAMGFAWMSLQTSSIFLNVYRFKHQTLYEKNELLTQKFSPQIMVDRLKNCNSSPLPAPRPTRAPELTEKKIDLSTSESQAVVSVKTPIVGEDRRLSP